MGVRVQVLIRLKFGEEILEFAKRKEVGVVANMRMTSALRQLACFGFGSPTITTMAFMKSASELVNVVLMFLCDKCSRQCLAVQAKCKLCSDAH